MPKCCGVESEVLQVHEGGTVEYICPVCKGRYALAEFGKTFAKATDRGD